MRASEAASLKMPEPVTLACLAPAPASSSRHWPADSAWVISTVSLLKAMARERRTATVVKLPRPSLSILRRRSLPFWADMGAPLMSRRLREGTEAGGAADGLAVGVAADFGVLVTEVDEAMAGDSERLVVQGGADGAKHLVCLLLARCRGPDVHRENVLRAVLAACRPVLRRHPAEGDVGERGALRDVVEDAAGAEERGELGVGAEGGEDGLLEGPGGHGGYSGAPQTRRTARSRASRRASSSAACSEEETASSSSSSSRRRRATVWEDRRSSRRC